MVSRLLGMIPLIIGISLVSFLMMKLAPGDPTAIYMDPKIKAEDMALMRQNMGLDKPILVQYWVWLKQAVQGNLGYSYITGKPVVQAILERLPATLILSVSALILIITLTLPLGLISASKKDGWFDNLVTIATFIGLSIPTFWLGLVLILVFALRLGWFPTSGYLDPILVDQSGFRQAMDIAWHAVLPLTTILIGGLAGLTRYHRFGTIAILKQDYITAARARGLSEKRLLFKHAFKNAALPLVTLLGLSLPGLISGSFIVEYIFSWPGMGQLGVTAIFSRDYPVIMGLLLFSSLLIVIGNFLADLAYRWVDPRIQVT